ncbi:helix-turn-helix domain-containing protein [Tianweitania sediminis]|uniref:Helix-turn-helix domain-containing protein n=1 Tax=Tianweitania sediminis TaxID=1502156 RepID=A0A8J7QZ68_9HYPH|nr:helix-turn-helix domain-containing protein [Tianweitania sediminis]MBP0439463.1 helix-turn-helix domain-containing protein [Tianweitania sediminis]
MIVAARRDFDIERLSRSELMTYAEELEAQVEALASAARPDRPLHLNRVLRLTPSEMRILMALADGKPRSKEALLKALYWDRPDDNWPQPKNVDVHVCHTRQKVQGCGIDIRTIHSLGYQLTGVEALAKVLAGGKPEFSGLRRDQR